MYRWFGQLLPFRIRRDIRLMADVPALFSDRLAVWLVGAHFTHGTKDGKLSPRRRPFQIYVPPLCALTFSHSKAQGGPASRLMYLFSPSVFPFRLSLDMQPQFYSVPVFAIPIKNSLGSPLT